jgi:hypothetical protein
VVREQLAGQDAATEAMATRHDLLPPVILAAAVLLTMLLWAILIWIASMVL